MLLAIGYVLTSFCDLFNLSFFTSFDLIFVRFEFVDADVLNRVWADITSFIVDLIIIIAFRRRRIDARLTLAFTLLSLFKFTALQSVDRHGARV